MYRFFSLPLLRGWVQTLLGGLLGVSLSCCGMVWARSAATPWTDEMTFQNLVYGASSPRDVQNSLGRAPDEIIRVEQMFPRLENHLYYDENGSGAATVFVFQNNLLVGMSYKSPRNQYIDLTYFLPNQGDRQLNAYMNNGYYSYYPYFPFFSAW